MEQLVESCSVLATAGALTNQGRVRGKDDSFSHSTIAFATDFAVAELDVSMEEECHLHEDGKKNNNIELTHFVEGKHLNVGCS